jgi:regulator of cell morphogenesis and NO signaling
MTTETKFPLRQICLKPSLYGLFSLDHLWPLLRDHRGEENVLFPFIAQMDQESIVAYPRAHACFRSVSHPIFMMEQEHESANRIMAELHSLTAGFVPPEWACATHIAFFAGLSEFEADLKQHVHLENDVLFPHAMKLEAELDNRG